MRIPKVTWKWAVETEWLEWDKLWHLLAGLGVSVITGPVGGIFLGLGKEVIDGLSDYGSGFSYRDLVATLVGCIPGSLIFYLLVV